MAYLLSATKGPLLARARTSDALTEDRRERIFRNFRTLPDGSALGHFDLHPDHVMITTRRPVILDRMTNFHGDPAADVARTLLLFRIGQPLGASKVMLTNMDFVRRVVSADHKRRYLRLRPDVRFAPTRSPRPSTV